MHYPNSSHHGMDGHLCTINLQMKLQGIIDAKAAGHNRTVMMC